jgi:hypothetical protein
MNESLHPTPISQHVRKLTRIARQAASDRDVLFHRTRKLILTSGVLLYPMPGSPGVFMTRSPDAAAYRTLMERDSDKGRGQKIPMMKVAGKDSQGRLPRQPRRTVWKGVRAGLLNGIAPEVQRFAFTSPTAFAEPLSAFKRVGTAQAGAGQASETFVSLAMQAKIICRPYWDV